MIRRPATILVLLTGLNLLNYMDRYVLSAVLPKLRPELGLSRFESGLLATVFLLGYFATAPIFGTLGDRLPRKHLMAFGVAVWSLATLASGLATGLWSLVAARAFVGIGEASYATLAPTIIDDVTPPQRKGGALAVFYVATPIGSALGNLVGGFVGKHWGWREAFFAAGGPGLVLALSCLLLVEPERSVAHDKPDVRRDFRTLASIRTYRRAVLGYSAYTAAVGAFAYWAPEFLSKRYALELDVANFRFGAITVLAGAIATWLGGRWADRMRARIPKDLSTEQAEQETVRGLLRICAIGSFLGAPIATFCFLSPGSSGFFVGVFFCILALFLSTSPINAIILRSVPTELRASAMAISILSIHLLGDLWSPPFVGLVADHLPIQLAMMALPAFILASALLWWPRRAPA